MNHQIKQRIVGAVVLFSLAIIFIPVILDGDGRTPLEGEASNIPPKPGFHFEPLHIPAKPMPPLEARPAIIEREDDAPITTGPIAAIEDEKPQAADSMARMERADKPPVDSDGWVVQLGSFSSSKNALGLRDKLRGNGYKAFVEQLQSNDGPIYRVRVGPETYRDAAEKKRQQLEKDMGLKGLVMSHS